MLKIFGIELRNRKLEYFLVDVPLTKQPSTLHRLNQLVNNGRVEKGADVERFFFIVCIVEVSGRFGDDTTRLER